MQKEDYEFFNVNERVIVTAEYNEVYVEKKVKKKQDSKKGCRIRQDNFDRLPRLVKNNLESIKAMVASKALGYIKFIVKDATRKIFLHHDVDAGITALDNIKFEFTFSAWFCQKKDVDDIVAFSACSILDTYDKKEGKRTAFKRLQNAYHILENGKKGKLYDLEEWEDEDKDAHGRGLKGVITDEGIDKIRC